MVIVLGGCVQKPELLLGGDITELSYVEDSGGVFYDRNGVRGDPVRILADAGWNVARIRVYNRPGKGRGDGKYYLPEGYQDAEDALRLARRAKDAGLKIALSFHYSDFWTNPSTQMIPQDWQELIRDKPPDEAAAVLERELYLFTKNVLDRLAAQGTSPEYVSLGNETRGGMLFPYGTVKDWQTLAGFYNAGAKAVRESAAAAKIIIHLDEGGNLDTYRWYFGEAEKHRVDYDVIGASYYPYWTRKTAKEFAGFCGAVAGEFKKPVFCMETGFNWTANSGAGRTGQLQDNGPYGDKNSSAPKLQKAFLTELFEEMRNVKNRGCIGDLYWDPVMIYADGKTGWAYFEVTDKPDVNVVDNTALFDFDGKALEALEAYR